MSWVKKKTNGQNAEIEVPLVDQPFQMPEKTNEELLAELNRVAKWRLKTGAMFVVTMSLTVIGLIVIPIQEIYLDHHIIVDASNMLQAIDQQQAKRAIIEHALLPYLIFGIVPYAYILFQSILAKINTNRIALLISELVRRKETSVIVPITKIYTFGNVALFDPNRKLSISAVQQLLPYLSQEEFESGGMFVQMTLIKLLNHFDASVREQTRLFIIKYGDTKTIKFLRLTLSDFILPVGKWNPTLNFLTIKNLITPDQSRPIDSETYLDFKSNIDLCIKGIKERLADEYKQSQLLRPSSAITNETELLRAATGGGSSIEPDKLLRSSSAKEISATEIAAKYLPKVEDDSTSVESIHPVNPVHPV